MCKIFFYTFLYFLIFELKDESKDKIEPIEPKLDLSEIILFFDFIYK